MNWMFEGLNCLQKHVLENYHSLSFSTQSFKMFSHFQGIDCVFTRTKLVAAGVN